MKKLILFTSWAAILSLTSTARADFNKECPRYPSLRQARGSIDRTKIRFRSRRKGQSVRHRQRGTQPRECRALVYEYAEHVRLFASAARAAPELSHTAPTRCP